MKKIINIFLILLILVICFTSCEDNHDKYLKLMDDDEIVTQKLIGQEFDFQYEENTSGTLKYKFNSITAYDNLYDLAGEDLKNNLEHPARLGCDLNVLIMYDVENEKNEAE